MRHYDLVWRILSGIPIEVYDETDYSVWSSEMWELVAARTEGDFAGQRTIGSANIISAYNLFHLKMIANHETVDNTLAEFKSTLDYLEKNKLIRRRPEKLRSTFKTV
jgi:hypothetical protein